MSEKIEIGEVVRKTRMEAGLSQAELAETAGLSNETISRLERGAFEASLATAVALADALGVNLDYLAGRAKRVRRKEAASPTVAKLAARAEKLPGAAQRALLKLAEMIPEAAPKSGRRTRSRP